MGNSSNIGVIHQLPAQVRVPPPPLLISLNPPLDWWDSFPTEVAKQKALNSLTRVDEVGPRIQQDLQRFHVVVEILEHGRAFTQDAVTGEKRLLLLQQQGHVVVSMAWGEQDSVGKTPLNYLFQLIYNQETCFISILCLTLFLIQLQNHKASI